MKNLNSEISRITQVSIFKLFNLLQWLFEVKFTEMLETVNPCFNSMPECVQKEFTKDMMHEICSMKEDELYVVPLRIMYFVAEKCQIN